VSSAAVRVRVLESLQAVPAAAWDGLVTGDNPFVRHAYLSALESSGAVGEEAGWVPRHLMLEDEDGGLVGALPLYLKDNSWGEFVFDFAWADAYHRAGVPYYPKLVAAVPFTPVPGPRCLVSDPRRRSMLAGRLLEEARALAGREGASSLHVLFPDDRETGDLVASGLSIRQDCQFHWSDEGYGDFEGFLAALTAEKRKKLRRERRRVVEAGIRFRRLAGRDLPESLFDDFYRFYASSFLRRGMAPYFPPAFWRSVLQSMGESIRIVFAEHDGHPVACAVFFVAGDTLYGRYWGCDQDFHSLHFETCFYQGIELALAEGRRRFEPGAQGEHKLRRGFRPVATWSGHWLAHPGFAGAIDQWLERERAHVKDYMAAAEHHLPFRRNETQ